MRLMRTLPLVVCLALGTAAAQEQPAPQPKQKQTRAEAMATPEQQQVLQASDRLRQAILASEPDQIRQILATNYTGTDLMGRRLDRFGAVEAAAFNAMRFEKVDIETQSVQVSGDNAVQTGSAYVQGYSRGELFNATYRFVRQWQRVNGEWKLVSTQIQGLGGTF